MVDVQSLIPAMIPVDMMIFYPSELTNHWIFIDAGGCLLTTEGFTADKRLTVGSIWPAFVISWWFPEKIDRLLLNRYQCSTLENISWILDISPLYLITLRVQSRTESSALSSDAKLREKHNMEANNGMSSSAVFLLLGISWDSGYFSFSPIWRRRYWSTCISRDSPTGGSPTQLNGMHFRHADLIRT